MLRGGDVKEIYEMHGRGHSARAIARGLGLARNTVLRYLNSPEAMLPKPRPPRRVEAGPLHRVPRPETGGGVVGKPPAAGPEHLRLRGLRVLRDVETVAVAVDYGVRGGA